MFYTDVPPEPPRHYACYVQAAVDYRLPLGILPAIAKVEGGEAGMSSQNTNGTRDHGHMQINDVWMRHFAQKGADIAAIKNDVCMSIKAAAYILRVEIDRAGDFWMGVGRYHSRTPHLHQRYLSKVAPLAAQLEPVYKAFLSNTRLF